MDGYTPYEHGTTYIIEKKMVSVVKIIITKSAECDQIKQFTIKLYWLLCLKVQNDLSCCTNIKSVMKRNGFYSNCKLKGATQHLYQAGKPRKTALP